MNDVEERNKRLVLDWLDAIGTLDYEKYEHFLADEPIYWVGMNRQVGREAFRTNTEIGKHLYPHPETTSHTRLAVLASGDWVSVLQIARAETNLVSNYENIYAIFVEVKDGKIATQAEILDSALAATKFDFSALQVPGR